MNEYRSPRVFEKYNRRVVRVSSEEPVPIISGMTLNEG